MKTETYLREEFTARIIQSLLESRLSINLIGAKGTGKTRLLDDICRSGLTGVKVVKIDLKAYQNSYTGLLREIHSQLGEKGEIPAKLGRFFEGFEGRPGKCLLLFDNYDALLDNPQIDRAYDIAFYDDLNYIKNKPNISLLCTTGKAHNTLPVFIAGESYRNSWLDLEKESLPPLDVSQIQKELARQSSEPVTRHLKKQPAEYDLLLAAIHNRPFAYTRICFLVKKLNTQAPTGGSLIMKKRLKKWLKEWQKLESPGIDKRGHRIKGRIRAFLVSSGLNNIQIPIVGKLSKILDKWCEHT